MLVKLIEKTVDFFAKGGKHALTVKVVLLFIVIAPIATTETLNYFQTKDHLTELTFSRRESIAHLAFLTLKEKFDRLTDLGVSFATRVQFRKDIAEGKWEEAIQILKDVPVNFPFIDRVFLADPSGTLMADTPALPGVRGKNFSFRDWYQGVIATQKPYLSEIYKRTAEPQYNVMAVATPIKDEGGNFIGILVMQVKLETFFDWAQEVEVGLGGFIYFVDKNAHGVGHPDFPPQGEIADFSEVAEIQKVLAGESGIEKNQERIVAYEPVLGFGWGVVVEQPTSLAFAPQNARLSQIILIDILTLVIVSLLAYFLLRFISSLNSYRQREKIYLQSIGDALLAIDRSWNITLFNTAAQKITGWSHDEVVGKSLRETIKFIKEQDRKENIAFIEEAMLYGEIRLMQDHTLLIAKDGKEIPVEDSAAPVFDENGKVAGAIIIFRDVSKARELEKTREEFASLATHQMRAPLTAIEGFSDMVLEEPLNENQKYNLLKIQEANTRLLTLVNALLNVSRIELGTLAIQPEPTFIPNIAQVTLKELAPQIKDKKLKLETHFAKDLPSIKVDPQLTRVIFQNLLSNAVQYTPAGGTVKLSLEKKEGNVLIRVSDTGIGIPKEAQPKIFQKLFRADNAQGASPEGTGLGLYIVKSVVEQGGGKIWFESEEGKGTTFYVAIPLSGMKKKEGIKGLT